MLNLAFEDSILIFLFLLELLNLFFMFVDELVNSLLKLKNSSFEALVLSFEKFVLFFFVRETVPQKFILLQLLFLIFPGFLLEVLEGL